MVIPEGSRVEALVNLLATTAVGALVYASVGYLFKSPELLRIRSLVTRSG
jgi:hypothetical protein